MTPKRNLLRKSTLRLEHTKHRSAKRDAPTILPMGVLLPASASVPLLLPTSDLVLHHLKDPRLRPLQHGRRGHEASHLHRKGPSNHTLPQLEHHERAQLAAH